MVAAAVLFFLVLGGATYQGVATAIERRQLTHPGQLVDIGGHQLHLYCTGSGSPSVILEAPAAAMSSAWGWVQPAIDGTRVCSYDRAGLGWSEAGDAPYDPARVAGQLHTLLGRAREQGPFVVVGQGLGAAFARLFAVRYPAEVAALVLIDPAAVEDEGGSSMSERVSLSPWLARAGVLRASRTPSGRVNGLPDTARDPLRSFLYRPDHLTRATRELAQWNRTVTLAGAAALPPALPVIEVRIDEGGRRTAVLNRSEQADRAVAAIREAISRAKAR